MVTACAGVLFPAQPAGPHTRPLSLSSLPPFLSVLTLPPSPLFIDRAIQRASSASSRMKAAKGKGATKKETKPALKPVDDRGVGKRKAAAKPVKSKVKKPKKEEKVKKDPNKPKRPASAFFVFLEEFRKTYKQEHPNVKAVSAVGKAGGEKWKALSKAEKAPYEAKAAKRKVEYEKQMSAYNKKQESGAEAEADEEEEEGSEQSGEEEGEEEEDDEEEDDE